MVIPKSTCLWHTALHDHEGVGRAVDGEGYVTSDRAQQMCRKSFWTPPDWSALPGQGGDLLEVAQLLPTFTESIQLALGIQGEGGSVPQRAGPILDSCQTRVKVCSLYSMALERGWGRSWALRIFMGPFQFRIFCDLLNQDWAWLFFQFHVVMYFCYLKNN